MSQASVPPQTKPTLAEHATSSHQYVSCLRIAAEYVRTTVGTADMAIVLGSGLMDFVNNFQQHPPPKSVSYDQVPYMPGTNVPGHSGRIYVGDLPTKHGLSKVMCFAGRVHAYEGWNSTEFNFIVRLAHMCGVKVMLLTNSAGGALQGMHEGSIMMIEDHIRFSGINPLRDVQDDPRFGDKHCTSSFAYSKRIQDIVKTAAHKLKMDVLAGTYCWTSGPSYETPSEVKAGQLLSVNSLGGAFGMSTVPEVLAAHNLGMEVFAVSLCTNLAAGLSDKELTHGDVKTVAEAAGPRFQALLLETFSKLEVKASEAKAVLPADFDANVVPLSALAAVPSSPLEPVGGWTPSVTQVHESIARINRLNAGSPYNTLTAGVIFFGGRGQSQAATTFLSQLTHIQSIPLRDLSSAFTARPGMLSSYARTAQFFLGTLPAERSAGKRVAVVVSGDGNGVVGLTSAEQAWMVQVLHGLGASTIFGSAVGVDTSNRTVGGAVHSNADAASVLLVEDVLDRQIDPAPLLTSINEDHVADKSVTFDPSLSKAVVAALTHDQKHAPGLKTGAFLSFQGPMLPTEAELNIAFHAGAVAAAGISNLAFADIAKQLGLKVVVALRLVKSVIEIPVPHDSKHHKEDEILANNIAVSFARVLNSEAAVSSIPHNVADLSVASSSNVEAYGPVQAVAHPETIASIRAASQWLRGQLGASASTIRTFAFVEGMLADVFAADFTVKQEWTLGEVPNFLSELGVGTTRSGACYPYDPRTLMASWRLRLVASPTGLLVLLLVNTVDRTSTVPAFHGLNFFVRVAKELEKDGLTNLLLLSPVASCSVELAPGAFVVLKDHINMTGLNPLFGENTPQYGPRFNDMSQVYKPSGIAAFDPPNSPCKFHQSIVMQVPNPALSSLSEAALARSVHASTLVSGLTPLSTIAKHQDSFVTAIGYVYRTAGTTDDLHVINSNAATSAIHTSTTLPSAQVVAQMRANIASRIEVLHQAGVEHLESLQAAAASAAH